MKHYFQKIIGLPIYYANSQYGDYTYRGHYKPIRGLKTESIAGFHNIQLSDEFIVKQLLSDEFATIQNSEKNVVIDYSSPNIAKELHIGHLRTTIIGDCIANVMDLQGNTVIRQNHIGDRSVVQKIPTQLSLICLQQIYDRLSVKLKPEHIKPESSYLLDCENLIKRFGNIISTGNIIPLILKRDNGRYTYAAIDLAALIYRIEKLKADKLIYVTDNRQKLHFDNLFSFAKTIYPNIKFNFVGTGCILGSDKKPLKSREGNPPLLKDIIGHIISLTHDMNLSIGALKYYEYKHNISTDYIFDEKKMLDLNGNTFVYIQYTYCRIVSLLHKTNIVFLEDSNFTNDLERDIAKHLLKYADIIDDFNYNPNSIIDYLHKLCRKFNTLYNDEKFIGSKNENLKILLCKKIHNIIIKCCALLGLTLNETI